MLKHSLIAVFTLFSACKAYSNAYVASPYYPRYYPPPPRSYAYNPARYSRLVENTQPNQPLFDSEPFCQGQPLHDGTQNRAGGCSNTIMGQIPDTNNMVSTLITSPENGSTLKPNEDVIVSFLLSNMETGSFDDANTKYYVQPQILNQQGKIKGHSHVVIQKIADSRRPMDPNLFTFFQGVDSQGINLGQNFVKIDMTVPFSLFRDAGPGTFRICTMSSSSGHQPVVMPIARRGAQDDCVRIKLE